MAKNEYNEVRGRNFAFVQKVENLPENWRQVVSDKLLPMAYVVHDKDVGTDPHVHFYVYFSGKRTASGVVQLFSELNIAYVEKVECKNAYLAYMLHLRQEDKHTYDFDEMVILNGLRVNFAELANVDFSDVLDFIEEHNCVKFCELLQWSRRLNPPLFRYVANHHALVVSYFSDVRQG